jgi:hypothetical protein
MIFFMRLPQWTVPMPVRTMFSRWREERPGAGALHSAREFMRENGAGLAASTLLHGFFILLLIFFALSRTGSDQSKKAPHVLSVDIIQMASDTIAPPARQKADVPRQRAARIPAPRSTSPKPAVGVAPNKETPPPIDNIEAKIRGLARLRQPDAPVRALDNEQTADVDTTSNGAASGDVARYGLRDYIRAQAERRWSLNNPALRNRNLVVLLRVTITRTGTVTKSEIVNQARFLSDAGFHEIALSARNAVILSSPFALPPGDYQDVMNLTLSLNPKDTLR